MVLRIPACLSSLRLREYYPLRLQLSICYSAHKFKHSAGPYPELHCCSSVWALPRSLATTYGITFVFSSCGYLDVSVPHVSLLHTMDSCTGDRAFISAGFPHSEICASSAICAFTQLIAACHVLLRLLVPRHSPYALSSLTFFLILQSCFFKTFAFLISNIFEILKSFRQRLSSLMFPSVILKTIHTFMMYYPPLLSKGLPCFQWLCFFVFSFFHKIISLFSFQGTHRIEQSSMLWIAKLIALEVFRLLSKLRLNCFVV